MEGRPIAANMAGDRDDSRESRIMEGVSMTLASEGIVTSIEICGEI